MAESTPPIRPAFQNRVIRKGQLRNLIAWSFTNYGTARTAHMADLLKNLGFKFATRAGVSISVDDLQIPAIKRELLEAAEEEIRKTETKYVRGEITEVERFQKVIDTWNGTSENLKDEVVRNFEANDPLNSVYMMAFSGARGNLSQVRQLVGMRGLMANPQGEIIDLPIKTNFREGLTVTEYVISSYGARKGLVDTALRTADSGYLTRRLVDVSQDTIVREIDCGTERGIPVRAMTDGEKILIPLSSRLLGRVAAVDVLHPTTGEVLVARNGAISDELAKEIGRAGVEEIMVRSPLTCEAARSVCRHCYGWSLAHGHMVDMGEAVGIIAAQSIGEPGTQLTMRTFHTGGVFTGEVEGQIRTKIDGTLKLPKSLRARSFRTRHGEDALVVEANGKIHIESGSKKETIEVAQGSILISRDGEAVKAGQVLGEIQAASRTKRKSTEKATKDVSADLAGEVLFDGIMPEEKKDRQGNTTRIAQRGGLIWVLSGEVYNLLPGAEPTVKNGDRVVPGSVLAETRLATEHGGVVRLPPEELQENKSSREIQIITASVLLDQARVRSESAQGRDHYLIETDRGELFSLIAAPGTKVLHGQVVAELIDDRYRTATGGLLRYSGVEVAKKGKAKQGYEVVKGGTLLWIPEETHEVNKDISLLMVEDGQYVEAGTEIVKDIFCQNPGIVEVTQKNDILREISIKPGELRLVDDPDLVMAIDGKTVAPGQEIIPGLIAEVLTCVEYVETPEGSALLMRPVEEFTVPDEPAIPSQESGEDSGRAIRLRAIQRLTYKDEERVKSVDGIDLLRTQLVLEMEKGTPQLAADIELLPDPDADPAIVNAPQRLQLVILESLVVRRDAAADSTQGSTHTNIQVKDGDVVAPGEVVARTEIQCKDGGEVRGIRADSEMLRRLLVVRESDRMSLPLEGHTATVKPGDLVVAGKTELAAGLIAQDSGQVLAIEEDGVLLRIARPYRVSSQAVLHIDDNDLVQRGDNLVLLVFERAKTGDIIQGLPRIEELLEARKPKESCVIARRPGTAQVVFAEEEAEVKVIEVDGTIAEYPIRPGQNILIADGQTVIAGESLTDGPINPHELLEVLFAHEIESRASYEAALQALQRVQSFLVNEVQSVYQSQGIEIADKHIEVIVRQMTSKVRIEDGGDTTMLPGELIELQQVERVNEAMSITGAAPALYTPVLLGITKASLNTDSFISAASFQETTRVLTEAAIEGKSDWLRGLKENVIIGRLIPAGTGFNAYEEGGAEYEAAYDGTGYTIVDGVMYDEDDFAEVILDDRSARAYELDGGLAYADGGLVYGQNPAIINDENIEVPVVRARVDEPDVDELPIEDIVLDEVDDEADEDDDEFEDDVDETDEDF